ncbi:hypothetical protein JXO59_15490 [candidate division KSB1 bacterium]|nr:hypothetical protein [candidate division KSB1 bacterium]
MFFIYRAKPRRFSHRFKANGASASLSSAWGHPVQNRMSWRGFVRNLILFLLILFLFLSLRSRPQQPTPDASTPVDITVEEILIQP